MNLRQIEAFRAMILGATTVRAAELLGVSQPAISKSLQELERAVGFRLFERTGGRLLPTPEGQLLYRAVDQAFSGMAHIRSAAARIRDFGVGELRIGCLSAFSNNIVPQAINRFRQGNPEVAITLQVQGSPRLRDMVAAGECDIAITSDEVDTTGTLAQPFIRTTAEVALPPGHALCDRASLTFADLHKQNFIALVAEDTTRREAEAQFKAVDATPQVVVETPFSTTICALVLAGVGCGIVDPVTAIGFRERGLVLKLLTPEIQFRTLLLFPPQQQLSGNVSTFVNDLRHEARAAGGKLA